MATYVTTKTVELDRIVGYVDTLGYLYCTYCKHAGLARSIITDRVLCHGGTCDLCSRSMATSIETITGTVIVEAIPCKIF